MTLKLVILGRFNPFMWDKFDCPLCGGYEFESITMTGVFCSKCYAKFTVRDTAGDPGCVVDCHTTKERGASIYAPRRECLECAKGGYGHETHRYLFDWQDQTCPINMNHGNMSLVQGISGPWSRPKTVDYDYFYMILKTGDYCSGWMLADTTRRKDRLGPTQKDWEAFQESEQFKVLIPSTEDIRMWS